jgi:hypothetical protein
LSGLVYEKPRLWPYFLRSPHKPDGFVRIGSRIDEGHHFHGKLQSSKFYNSANASRRFVFSCEAAEQLLRILNDDLMQSK